MTVPSPQQQFLERLRSWPAAPRCLVAFSGGLDSRVLLELALRARLPWTLAAIHVDHGLQPQSADWARQCAAVCAALGVPLTIERIDAAAPSGHSPEAWARRLRYAALRRHLGAGELLLTAHQRDDQAETVLLQLLRGGGPAGLAGMPALRAFGAGWHGRPLLDCDRAELHAFAGQAGLDWIEDASNSDPRFERNFLRARIMPLLRQRWPGMTATLLRAAELQAQAMELLEEVAAQDLRNCASGGEIEVSSFSVLAPARRANVLRAWLRQRGLPLPGAAQLAQVQDAVLGAGADRNPCLRWPGAELRRWRGRLYAAPPPLPRDARDALAWQPGPLACELDHGLLAAEPGGTGDLDAMAVAGADATIRFRHGGERLKPAGARHHRELRLLFQERGVPPWLRDRIPLLYLDGRLAAVPGLCVDAEFAAAPGARAWRLRWTEARPGGAE